MYYHQESNRYIAEGQEFTLNGVDYSAMWLSQVGTEDIAAMGLETVTFEGENKDTRFYWNGLEYDGAIIRTINTPRNLDDVQANLTYQIKADVFNILQPTDYIDIRNLRDPSYKPDWVTWRDSVRTYASDTTTAINNALDIAAIEAIMATFSWPHDPSYVAPAESAAVLDTII